MKKITLLLTFILFLGCGKSPLVNPSESKQDKESNQTSLTGKLSIASSERSTQSEQIKNIFVKALWQQGPDTITNNKLLVLLLDEKGKRVSISDEIYAYIWMPGMGHGSSPIDHIKISDGVYELDSIYFIMGGYWELHLQIKKEETVLSEVIWPINL